MLAYRKDIEGLRAIAVTSVVLFHVGWPYILGGYVGVDVFFVISGFLITGLLIDEVGKSGRVDFASFYAKRVRRLFPSLFVVVLVTVLLSVLFLTPFGEQQALSASAVSTIFFVSNIYFWTHTGTYFDESTDLAPLLHTWSLAVEEQFYLTWPLLILLAYRFMARRQGDFLKSLLVIVLLVSLVSLALCIWMTAAHPVPAFYIMPTRAWQFGCGALLAIAARSGYSLSSSPAAAASVAGGGLLCILIALFSFSDSTPFPGVAAILPTLGTAMLIAAGSMHPGNPFSQALSTRLPRFLGQISYSWYLWHWPILAIPRAYALGEREIVRDTVLGAISLLLAYLTTRYLETPIRERRLFGSPRSARVLAVGVVCMLSLSALAWASGQWADRSLVRNPRFAELKAAKADRPQALTECTLIDWIKRAEEPASGRCATAVPPAGSLLLLGDSHGEMLWPLLSQIPDLPRTSLVSAARVGCPPLIRADVRTTWNTPSGCEDLRAALDAAIGSGQLPAAVVLASRWTLYLNQGALDRRHRDLKHLVVDDRKLDQDASLQLVYRDVREFLEQANAQGTRVLLVAPFPDQKTMVPECLARRPEDGCAISREQTMAFRARITGTLQRAAAGLPNVRIWDPLPVLCPESREACPLFQDGHLIYSDSSHITATVSRALAASAMNDMRWLLRRETAEPANPNLRSAVP